MNSIPLRIGLFHCALVMILAAQAFAQFKPPDEKQRRSAVGSLEKLTPALRKAFEPGEGFFEPIPIPAPGDWLAAHPENEQTFDQFLASRPNRPDARRNKLYFLPLGAFDKERSPSLEKLREFASAFFMMDVKLLDPIEGLAPLKITSRINDHTRQKQLLSTDILHLLTRRVPDDAYALLAITMVDLYPDPAWNYVFGQASLRDRVGVYSFARYDPVFFGHDREKGWEKLMLRRSCSVLAHETVHMFGVGHCVHYTCLINGSNHLQESDSRPNRLCPVDLRKLQWSIGFDVVQRYRRLRDFNKSAGFDDEAAWLDRRIAFLTAP